MAIIDFGGSKEEVVTRKEFPMSKARQVLKGETIAVIGYGVQGPAQALNLRDNGFNVIIGQRSKERAIKDGWVPGKTLFDIDEAVRRGTLIQLLVSDAAQRAIWPVVKQNLKPGDALCFSHGRSQSAIIFEGTELDIVGLKTSQAAFQSKRGSKGDVVAGINDGAERGLPRKICGQNRILQVECASAIRDGAVT